jgi:formate dehydrogenase subunit delta
VRDTPVVVSTAKSRHGQDTVAAALAGKQRMKLEKLIRMANEIARNLSSQPGDQAGAATAEHIRSFWTPGMRSSLIAHSGDSGEGLDPIALQAARLLAEARVD